MDNFQNEPVRTLTADEQALLTREIAADKYAGCYNESSGRRAFIAGWDAALTHVEERQRVQRKALEGCERIFVHGSENTPDREWGQVYDLVREALGRES